MQARFSNSYVDRIFAERDLVSIHHLISVANSNKALPDECWVFCQIIEWVGSIRSGVWQYYENIPKETVERVGEALETYGHPEIAERYRSGMVTWNEPNHASDLDKWIFVHEQAIENAGFEMIKQHHEFLKKTVE
jgi:hypothetical protein